MKLAKPFSAPELVAGLESAGLADAEGFAQTLVTTMVLWILGSFAFLATGGGSALWGVAQSIFQMAIPYISQSLNQLGASLGMPQLSIAGSPMSLSKAWDFNALLTSLKVQGVPELEKIADDVFGVVFDWLESSFALMSQTSPLWGMVAPVLTAMQPMIEAEFNSLMGAAAPPVASPVASPAMKVSTHAVAPHPAAPVKK